MRSSVTPGTNLALFCIQNLGEENRKKLLIKVGLKTRGAQKRDIETNTSGLYSTDFMTLVKIS